MRAGSKRRRGDGNDAAQRQRLRNADHSPCGRIHKRHGSIGNNAAAIRCGHGRGKGQIGSRYGGIRAGRSERCRCGFIDNLLHGAGIGKIRGACLASKRGGDGVRADRERRSGRVNGHSREVDSHRNPQSGCTILEDNRSNRDFAPACGNSCRKGDLISVIGGIRVPNHSDNG